MFRGLNSQNTVMLKNQTFRSLKAHKNLRVAAFRGLELTKHCNAQKFPKLQKSDIYGQADGRFLKILEFLSTTVFREFQGWQKLMFLSITVFRGLNFTKHCNAQKVSTFRSFKVHKAWA